MTAAYTAGPAAVDAWSSVWRRIYRDDEWVASVRLTDAIPFDAELAQDLCAALWAHEQRLRGAP